MPKLIAPIHEKLIERYLMGNHKKHLSNFFERIWLKDSDMSIIPCKLEVQTCVSASKGLILVGFFDPVGEIVAQNMNCRFKDAYIVLTDELGYIMCASSNFKTRFFRKEQYAIDDLKINIEEIIIGISDHSEEDLKNGVKAKLSKDVYDAEFPSLTYNDNTQINIMLCSKKYNIPFNVSFKEYIFVETKGDSIYFNQKTAEIVRQ